MEDTAAADLCVINTCSLTSQATSKCRRKVRSILRKNPDVCVATVGCYAQTDVEALRNIGGVDYIVGTADKLRLPEIVASPVKLPEAVVVRERTVKERFSVPGAGYYPFHTRANLKIQEGCDFVCSYCIIPRSRGPARSRDFDDVVREACDLVSFGHRELILTGINMGTYWDGGRGLADLVEALSNLEGLERIRLSSIEPTTVEGTLIDMMAEGQKLCPYFHIPAQSGDDEVLLRMRRKYRVSEYVAFIRDIIKRVPNVGLGTDIMVGFPGESESAFQRSCELVEEIPFTHIHVFSFSARRRTAAYSIKEKVPAREITRRSAAMHDIADKKKQAYYEAQQARTLNVLFEERESNGLFVGFSGNYVKVGVDTPLDLSNRLATVRISRIEQAAPKSSILAVGEMIEVESHSSGVKRGCG